MAAEIAPQGQVPAAGFFTGSYPTDKPASRAARRHPPTHGARPHPEQPDQPATPRQQPAHSPPPPQPPPPPPPAPATGNTLSRPPPRSSGKFPANATTPDEGGFF